MYKDQYVSVKLILMCVNISLKKQHYTRKVCLVAFSWLKEKKNMCCTLYEHGEKEMRKFVEGKSLDVPVWELWKPDLAHQKHPFQSTRCAKRSINHICLMCSVWRTWARLEGKMPEHVHFWCSKAIQVFTFPFGFLKESAILALESG